MKTLTLMFITVLILTVVASDLGGQDAGPLGMPSPDSVFTETIEDTSFVKILTSVEVLGEGFVGVPSIKVRVLATWGQWARLDSGEITLKVFLALNMDGFEFRGFKLGELLRPAVECIKTEDEAPVVYMSYGLPATRQWIRIETDFESIQVSAAEPGSC